MNLRNLNKGQKILLFVFLPVMLIIISIAITIIFDDSKKNDDQLSSSTDAINVDIPDAFAKTDTDVIKAYQNEQDKNKLSDIGYNFIAEILKLIREYS